MKNTTVDILGVSYSVIFEVDASELPENADGCMDFSVKAIKIAKLENERGSVHDLEAYIKGIVRHEIVHAFLYESGLWSSSCSVEAWATSEEIVDWIAIQFPKIYKAFKKVGCL